jgi:hypothetical protein
MRDYRILKQEVCALALCLRYTYINMTIEMAEKVTIFPEEDARSVDSYASYDSIAREPRGRLAKRPGEKLLNRGPLMVDGKVPDVLHTLEYVGDRNFVVAGKSNLSIPIQKTCN